MRNVSVALAGALLIFACPPGAAQNPCTNGSFEKLSPQGFPVDWEAVGRTVEVTTEKDAHTGRQALRMLRTNLVAGRDFPALLD